MLDMNSRNVDPGSFGGSEEPKDTVHLMEHETNEVFVTRRDEDIDAGQPRLLRIGFAVIRI